jgi:hypothetical protein
VVNRLRFVDLSRQYPGFFWLDVVEYRSLSIVDRHAHMFVHNIPISNGLISNVDIRYSITVFAFYIGIIDRHGHLLVHNIPISDRLLSHVDILNYLLSI